MNRTLSIVVVALAGLMILILALVVYLMLSDSSADTTVVAATSEATEIAFTVTETKSSSLPTAVVEVRPTDTVPPSPTPTETLVPTDTPLPTNTPLPPTNTPVPVVIVPTNPPPPPPPLQTNTPEPAPPPPDNRGLVTTYFDIDWERSTLAVNQSIWFAFGLQNTTGGEVPYSRLGVMPRKDGADRPEWFQQSYGGPNATIKTQGLDHVDNIKLPEAGNYTLRLAICFDGYDACQSGGGNWATMSHEIPVTIN